MVGFKARAVYTGKGSPIYLDISDTVLAASQSLLGVFVEEL